MRPLIVIRSNLESSDMIIYDADPLESSLETLFASVIDPNSPHFISSEYLMYRLIDCTSRIQVVGNIYGTYGTKRLFFL